MLDMGAAPSLGPRTGEQYPTCLVADPKFYAALKLHEYLSSFHWDGCALKGPDVGIKFNSRIGRFIKGYLADVKWNDNYRYVQAQGYWILDNWLLYSVTSDARFRTSALRCSDFLLGEQQEDGGWLYPNPEWKG